MKKKKEADLNSYLTKTKMALSFINTNINIL